MDVANWKIRKTVTQIRGFAVCRIRHVGCINDSL